jgi:GT2 family glycosyltransferase
MAEFLDTNAKTPMVATDFHRIDSAGQICGYSSNHYACFLYRSEAAKRVGQYRPEFALVEDVDFFLRLAHFEGPVQFIHKPYYKYRDHSDSLSAKKTSRRQLVSVKMHYDLITRSIEGLTLEQLFFDRIGQCALYRDYETIETILLFAKEKQVPFYSRLDQRAHFLRTKIGWIINKLSIAINSRYRQLKLD